MKTLKMLTLLIATIASLCQVVLAHSPERETIRMEVGEVRIRTMPFPRGDHLFAVRVDHSAVLKGLMDGQDIIMIGIHEGRTTLHFLVDGAEIFSSEIEVLLPHRIIDLVVRVGESENTLIQPRPLATGGDWRGPIFPDGHIAVARGERVVIPALEKELDALIVVGLAPGRCQFLIYVEGESSQSATDLQAPETQLVRVRVIGRNAENEHGFFDAPLGEEPGRGLGQSRDEDDSGLLQPRPVPDLQPSPVDSPRDDGKKSSQEHKISFDSWTGVTVSGSPKPMVSSPSAGSALGHDGVMGNPLGLLPSDTRKGRSCVATPEVPDASVTDNRDGIGSQPRQVSISMLNSDEPKGAGSPQGSVLVAGGAEQRSTLQPTRPLQDATDRRIAGASGRVGFTPKGSRVAAASPRGASPAQTSQMGQVAAGGPSATKKAPVRLTGTGTTATGKQSNPKAGLVDRLR